MDEIDLIRDVDFNSGHTMQLDDDEQQMMDEMIINKRNTSHIAKMKPSNPVPTKPSLKRRQSPRDNSMHGPEMDAFVNPVKKQTSFAEEDEYDDDDDDESLGMGDEGGYETTTGESNPAEGYNTIEEEKADLLNRLTRLKNKGHKVSGQLNAYSDVTQIRSEYQRIRYSIDAEAGIKFARRILIASTTGVEFLNKKYNPFDIHLEGWSESMMENVEDYDSVFEELYNKYKTSVAVAPEVKLIMMLGGSAMMFHLTHSMFKSAMPNIGQVMKQNPDLMSNMMSAVQNTMAPKAPEDPTLRPVATGGHREMQGPNMDLSSLMGNVMMPPPPPMNTSMPVIEEQSAEVTLADIQEIVQKEDDDDDISDIVSISTEGLIKEVNVPGGKKRGRKSNKKEISL